MNWKKQGIKKQAEILLEEMDELLATDDFDGLKTID